MMMIIAAMLLSVRPHLVPPGPRLLPIIGNLHLLYNRDLRALLQQFQLIYGNIFSLYVGRRLVVVASGKSLLKEVFVKNADKYSNRPCAIGNGRTNINTGILHNNGLIWHQQRRFVDMVFRDMDTRTNTTESRIAPEMIHLTCTLMELHQLPFDPRLFLMTATSNVIFSLLLGIRFDTGDPVFSHFYNNLKGVMHHPNFDSFVRSQRWPSWIPGSTYKKNRKLARDQSELEDFICRHIKSRLDACDAEEGSESVTSCLADAYIKKIRQNAVLGINNSYNVDNLIQIVLELVYLGTDSTTITLEWILLYLALNPQCQEKARDEIDQVLDGAFPAYSDRERLPYLEAVILESQRLADVNPFSMLHVSTADTMVEGLKIPSNTIIVPNMTSVLYDPKLFPRPEEFKPERFLGDRGLYLKKALLNPFFIGKRSCLCENLARMEIFLFVTAMLQHFWFALPEDNPPPSVQGIFEVRRRPEPFKVIAIQRHRN